HETVSDLIDGGATVELGSPVRNTGRIGRTTEIGNVQTLQLVHLCFSSHLFKTPIMSNRQAGPVHADPSAPWPAACSHLGHALGRAVWRVGCYSLAAATTPFE